jgi:hypothetical protein
VLKTTWSVAAAGAALRPAAMQIADRSGVFLVRVPAPHQAFPSVSTYGELTVNYSKWVCCAEDFNSCFTPFPHCEESRRRLRWSLDLSLFSQLGGFLGKCALPSTKRDGSTGYGGCARIYGRGRRRTALDGNLIHRSYQIHANIPCIWSVAAFPPCLNIAS